MYQNHPGSSYEPVTVKIPAGHFALKIDEVLCDNTIVRAAVQFCTARYYIIFDWLILIVFIGSDVSHQAGPGEACGKLHLFHHRRESFRLLARLLL